MLTPDYILGLVDGEGCFALRINRYDGKRSTVDARFMVKLQEADRPILEELKTFFGCGLIYVQNDKRPNHKRCYRFEVVSHKDLIAVILPFFKANPLRFVSKAKDFELFARALEIIEKQEHRTEIGKIEFEKLALEMH